MDLKGLWKEDEKWRWTSSWTNSPPSPIGHIFSSEIGTGVATPGKLPGKLPLRVGFDSAFTQAAT